MKQQSSSKELHKETMFLGVSLYDQFLSKGYFKNQRSLQIAGIASLTLATRIEENQPFNRSYLQTFYSLYSMEGKVIFQNLRIESYLLVAEKTEHEH